MGSVVHTQTYILLLSYNFIYSADGIFLNHLSQDIRGTNSSAVWRYVQIWVLVAAYLSGLVTLKI